MRGSQRRAFEEPEKSILGRGNRMYRSPEAGKCLAHSGNERKCEQSARSKT